MLILLFAFVAVQLAVALWLIRRIGTEDDFLVAGRRLGPALAATSIFATWFGAESCVGAAGAAYEGGWTAPSVASRLRRCCWSDARRRRSFAPSAARRHWPV